jgi:leucyl aminopeptidase
VTVLNGKTVEVLHTDAEGRLTLADGLSYAEKYIKPDIMIDLATLTGAVLIGLGNEITALMGNNRLLNEKFLKVCQEQGEMAWELPLYKSYLEA